MLVPVYYVEWCNQISHVQENLRQAALALSSDLARKSYADLLHGTFSNDEASFGLLFDQLSEIRNLTQNWDSYGAPAPGLNSTLAAKQAIEKLRLGQLLPELVAPSGEGGVAVYFSRGSQKAFIEFLNEGEVLLARYGKDDEPNVKVLRNGIQDLNDQTLQEIRNHLGARA
jgi:hypothetical protein